MFFPADQAGSEIMPVIAIGQFRRRGELEVEDAPMGVRFGLRPDTTVGDQRPDQQNFAAINKNASGRRVADLKHFSGVMRTGDYLERAVFQSDGVQVNPHGQHLLEDFLRGFDMWHSCFQRRLRK